MVRIEKIDFFLEKIKKNIKGFETAVIFIRILGLNLANLLFNPFSCESKVLKNGSITRLWVPRKRKIG